MCVRFVSVLCGIVALCNVSVFADGMLIPFHPKVIPPQWIKEDAGRAAWESYGGQAPQNVSIYEPGQRALILFNGTEEILLLSTELHASAPTAALEVVPFPSEPKVKLSDFQKLLDMEALLIKYTPVPAPPRPIPGMLSAKDSAGVEERIENAARITFHEQMGAHDLTVAEVKDKEYFSEWVLKRFQEWGVEEQTMGEEYAAVIDRYLLRKNTWFVFDSLLLGNAVQSRQPVGYRFATGRLYYPLEITSLQKGETVVDLLVVTDTPMKFQPRRFLKEIRAARVPRGELGHISKTWEVFMKSDSLYMTMLSVTGDISKMTRDIYGNPTTEAELNPTGTRVVGR